MKIDFVIPTYNRPDHLMCIISSIFAQTNPNWSIHVVGDSPPEGSLDKIMDYYKDSDKIKFTILPKRYNDWGHTPRNYGLHNSNEEWVVMTGEDNYYVPVFVDEFLSKVTEKSHFIYCDMVHNWVKQTYRCISSRPVYGLIDIGNFMTRTKFAKELSLDTTKLAADAIFVNDYLKKFPQGDIIHIEKALYVHN
jgi:glycosyltransferase involved in cell wall biosynthesis